MNRLIIIERKRIIPLILLIVLMGGLSLYDNFRGDFGEIMPVQDEDAKETGKTIAGEMIARELSDNNNIEFATADRGFRTSPKTFEVAQNLEEWVDIIENNDLSLPDYPYNEYTEAGVFAFNSEINNIELDSDNGKSINDRRQLELIVNIEQKDNHYHVIAVPKDILARKGDIQSWRFVNEEGDVVYQVTTEITD